MEDFPAQVLSTKASLGQAEGSNSGVPRPGVTF